MAAEQLDALAKAEPAEPLDNFMVEDDDPCAWMFPEWYPAARRGPMSNGAATGGVPETTSTLIKPWLAQGAIDAELQEITTAALATPPPTPEPQATGKSAQIGSAMLSDLTRATSAAEVAAPVQVYNVRGKDLAEQYPYADTWGVRTPDAGTPPSWSEPALQFSSRFECGNLLSAWRTGLREYELVLDLDINTVGHTQWFFFSMKGVMEGAEYRFNIINLAKVDSEFNYGMRPVLYSDRLARSDSMGWMRSGHGVTYFPNRYQRPNGRAYHSLTFTMVFPTTAAEAEQLSTKPENPLPVRESPGPAMAEPYFFAYHMPFSYTRLQRFLADLEAKFCPPAQLNADGPNPPPPPGQAGTDVVDGIWLRRSMLCRTLGGNRADLLTITGPWSSEEELASRVYVVISARVHPGETNASWIMDGMFDFLVSQDPVAVALRSRVIFKIVPMLNPDGVANGNHRCNLVGLDLNRQWRTPAKEDAPTIYYTKTLLSRIRLKSPSQDIAMYVDLHGHSRMKNVFMFGCHNDGHPVYALREKIFPWMLSRRSPFFAFKDCNFAIEAGKAGAGRVAVWREFGVLNSFTMESTYNGFNEGKLAGIQTNIGFLREMGRDSLRTLWDTLNPENVAEVEGAMETLKKLFAPARGSRAATDVPIQWGDDRLQPPGGLSAPPARSGPDASGKSRGGDGDQVLSEEEVDFGDLEDAEPNWADDNEGDDEEPLAGDDGSEGSLMFFDEFDDEFDESDDAADLTDGSEDEDEDMLDQEQDD